MRAKQWFTIVMSRGDISDHILTVEADDISLGLTDIYFTVKRRYTDRQFLFQKTLHSGDIYVIDAETNKYGFRINPSDTNGLSFGEYVCDIELVKAGNILRTFNGILCLVEEVTTVRDE